MPPLCQTFNENSKDKHYYPCYADEEAESQKAIFHVPDHTAGE